jgi:CHAT domain-containing protein
VVSSYIPTLHLLIKATNNWKPIPRSQLTGLIICESSSDNVESTYLPQAADEVSIVRNVFASAQAQVLNTPSDHTSLSDMRLLLAKTPAHVPHMACHGVHNEDPLKSALVLHDGRLTIENIMHLSLPRAVLAYLSAAKGDQNAPDQAVHLAASMLFYGFRSVIGTMW